MCMHMRVHCLVVSVQVSCSMAGIPGVTSAQRIRHHFDKSQIKDTSMHAPHFVLAADLTSRLLVAI
jgi:hypothetical protein